MKSFAAGETGAEREFIVKIYDVPGGDSRGVSIYASDHRAAIRAVMRQRGWRNPKWSELNVPGSYPMVEASFSRKRSITAWTWA